jgi:hypothetical protein
LSTKRRISLNRLCKKKNQRKTGVKEHQRAKHDNKEANGGQSHHAHMVAEFRRRFWVSLALTVPILVLSPMIQGLLKIEETLTFPGHLRVSWILASAVFLYGGWPFLKGLVGERPYVLLTGSDLPLAFLLLSNNTIDQALSPSKSGVLRLMVGRTDWDYSRI